MPDTRTDIDSFPRESGGVIRGALTPEFHVMVVPIKWGDPRKVRTDAD